MVPASNIKDERVNGVIRGIMSGGDCSALLRAIHAGDAVSFLHGKIEPTIRIAEEEKDQLRRDWLAASAEVNRLREELEYVAANVRAAAPAHIEAHVLRTLGRN